jgi:hypothetical protein
LLGESGIQFHAFQITGNSVSAATHNMASVINEATPPVSPAWSATPKT